MYKRQGNNSSLDSDMPDDLGDEEVAEGLGTLIHRTFTEEKQPQAVSELSYHQPNQPSQQDHAPSYPKPTQDQG